MRFIVTCAVHHKGRFIRKGDEISKDHPKFKRGLKAGWIVQVSDSAASPPKSKVRAPVVEVPAPVESEAPAPETETPWLVDGLDYLNNRAKESLREAGIGHVAQLHGWTIERLVELPGIAERTADRLLVTYEQYTDAVGFDAPVVNDPEEETVEYEIGDEEED